MLFKLFLFRELPEESFIWSNIVQITIQLLNFLLLLSEQALKIPEFSSYLEPMGYASLSKAL